MRPDSRRSDKRGIQTSFEITPIDELPEKERHALKRKRQERRADRKDRPLRFEGIWQTGWMLFKTGSIFSFKMIGATKMVQPVAQDNGNWGSKRRPTIRGCSYEPNKRVRTWK